MTPSVRDYIRRGYYLPYALIRLWRRVDPKMSLSLN